MGLYMHNMIVSKETTKSVGEGRGETFILTLILCPLAVPLNTYYSNGLDMDSSSILANNGFHCHSLEIHWKRPWTLAQSR